MSRSRGRVPNWVALLLLYLAIVLPARSASAGGQKEKSDDSATSSGGFPVQITFNSHIDCVSDTSVEALVNLYNDWPRWSDLQEHLGHIVNWCDTGLHDVSEKNPVVFTVVLGEHIYSAVYPQSQPYSQTLLGVERLHAILVADKDDLPTEPPGDFGFMFTQTRSPIEAQVPDFVKALVGGVLPPSANANKVLRTKTDTDHYALMLFVGQASEFPSNRGGVVQTGTVKLTSTAVNRLHADADAETKGISYSASYTDRPKQSFELTALAGALTGKIHGPEKMKVADDGTYASDPLGRTIGLAALAFHPWRFDSTRPTITKPEILSFWCGGVLTAPGIGAGASFAIVRGLTASIGYTWVWVPTSISGGAPKTAAPQGEQLAHKVNKALFLGGGYVFGKGGS